MRRPHFPLIQYHISVVHDGTLCRGQNRPPRHLCPSSRWRDSVGDCKSCQIPPVRYYPPSASWVCSALSYQLGNLWCNSKGEWPGGISPHYSVQLPPCGGILKPLHTNAIQLHKSHGYSLHTPLHVTIKSKSPQMKRLRLLKRRSNKQ